VLGFIVFFLFDTAVFRSGLYVAVTNPESYAGRVHAHFLWSQQRDAPAAPEILILGDSRVGEGFSAWGAQALLASESVRFFNGAVPGATLRVMNYILRQLDPLARRYALIALALPDYDDEDTPEDLANRQLDLVFLPDLIGLRDCFDVVNSFPRHANHTEALASCLLKGYAYRRDVQEFLGAPWTRLRDVGRWRAHGYHWLGVYSGRNEQLGDVGYDEASQSLVYGPSVPEPRRNALQSELSGVSGRRVSNRDYRLRWLGEIVSRYAESPTRLVLFQVPRGPFPAVFKRAGSPEAVRQLAASGRVQVLDEHLFEDLERPELFFDILHLNAGGRRLFTERLAKELEPLALRPAAAGASTGTAR